MLSIPVAGQRPAPTQNTPLLPERRPTDTGGLDSPAELQVPLAGPTPPSAGSGLRWPFRPFPQPHSSSLQRLRAPSHALTPGR